MLTFVEGKDVAELQGHPKGHLDDTILDQYKL